MSLRVVTVLSVFVLAIAAAGSAFAEDQYYNQSPVQQQNPYSDQDVNYIPPKYNNGKYYPNEYQGTIEYHGAENVSEDAGKTKQPTPAPYYYNYY